MHNTHIRHDLPKFKAEASDILLKASQIPLAHKRVETKFLLEVKCILESQIRMMYNKAPSLEELSQGRGSIGDSEDS